MRILFLSSEYPPQTGWGGIGSHVASVGRALAARGHKVDVLSCVREQERQDYRDGEIRVHRRPRFRLRVKRLVRAAPNTTSRLKTAFSCWREYRSLQRYFHVIEAPNWMAEGLAFALSGSRPLVGHLYTPMHLATGGTDLDIGWDERISDLLERTAMRRSDLIIAPSYFVVHQLCDEGWIEHGDVRVVRMPIDAERWRRTSAAETTRPVVLVVGRLEARKAPEVLVQASAALAPEVEGLEVVFVGRSNAMRGEKPYGQWLADLARDLGAPCRFMGHVTQEELERWYGLARVVAVPSRFESFSIAGLDAMAAGRPVVCTTATGIAELIDGSGAGAVVAPDDVEALSSALRPYLLSHKEAGRAGDLARALVKDCCSPEKVAEEQEKCYREAIERWRNKRVAAARGFPHAAPRSRAFAPHWWEWAVKEAAVTPWKHYYLRTAEQLLALLEHHPRFTGRRDLSGLSVLDVGCTPAVSALLACMGANVVMLDSSEEELMKADKLSRKLGISNGVRLACADAFALPSPFAPHTFDLVWNAGFIEHFDDPVGVVRRMAACGRPGSAVCVLTPARWTPHTACIRPLLRRRPDGYYWDYMGRERSYSEKDLVRILQQARVAPLRSMTGDLRRSFLDDNVGLPLLERLSVSRLLYGSMRLLDALERQLPPIRKLGFMAGAIGTVDQPAAPIK